MILRLIWAVDAERIAAALKQLECAFQRNFPDFDTLYYSAENYLVLEMTGGAEKSIEDLRSVLFWISLKDHFSVPLRISIVELEVRSSGFFGNCYLSHGTVRLLSSLRVALVWRCCLTSCNCTGFCRCVVQDITCGGMGVTFVLNCLRCTPQLVESQLSEKPDRVLRQYGTARVLNDYLTCFYCHFEEVGPFTPEPVDYLVHYFDSRSAILLEGQRQGKWDYYFKIGLFPDKKGGGKFRFVFNSELLRQIDKFQCGLDMTLYR